MSDKKSIDRLYQEKLKDFEATPSNSVWNNISSELQSINEKSKRAPLWWRIAEVAAAFLFLFTFSQLILDNYNSTPSQETIVDENSKKNGLNNNLENILNEENNNLVEENDSVKSKTGFSNIPLENQTTSSTENYTSANKSENTLLTSEDQINNSNSSSVKNSNLVTSTNKTKGAIEDYHSSNLSQEKRGSKNINTLKANTTQEISSHFKTTTTIVGSNLNNYGVHLTNIGSIKTSILIKDKKLSLTEAIAANENIMNPVKEKYEKWEVSSNISPVYFNAFGNGSSIHPQFNNNSKTGDVNMSYGISGSFAINKKFSVRAGINKVNLGYSTNDVLVFNNLDPSIDDNPPLLRRNIEIAEGAQNLSFISADLFNFAQIPNVLSNNFDGSIDQKLGFIEVPIEFIYKISDKKMGVNVIGGFSALFLNENSVFSTFDGNTILLGKATNINNTSFSANFGLGFDFKISNKFNLNFEPIFKYQLNTFNNTSGNFKPFFIGVYSGLKFKF